MKRVTVPVSRGSFHSMLGGGGLRLRDGLHLTGGLAPFVGLRPDLAVAMDLDDELGRERVHDRNADAVQTAGDFVAGATELSAGVQDRMHDLERGLAGLLLFVDGDTAPVIGDRYVFRLVDPHVDAVARAVHRLVDGVVEDLTHEVVQTTDVGRADVHAGTATHGLEALEDLDVLRAV